LLKELHIGNLNFKADSTSCRQLSLIKALVAIDKPHSKLDFSSALSVLDLINEQEIAPSLHHYTMLITALGKNCDVSKAFELNKQTLKAKMKPNAIMINALVSSCRQSIQSDQGVDLLYGIDQFNVQWTEILFQKEPAVSWIIIKGQKHIHSRRHIAPQDQADPLCSGGSLGVVKGWWLCTQLGSCSRQQYE